MGPDRVRLVIFDFDGVLADSEGIAIEELAAEITARGAPITPEEAQARFLGASTRDHMEYIAARTGQRVIAETAGKRIRIPVADQAVVAGGRGDLGLREQG